MSETVGMRLRADQAKISCVSITLRSSDFENRNRQMQLSSATDVTEEIYVSACRLFDELWDGKPLRLIGVSTSRVTMRSTGSIICLTRKNMISWKNAIKR